MRIAIGNDHGAVDMKNHVMGWLKDNGYEVVNFGTDSTESTDYPIYAAVPPDFQLVDVGKFDSLPEAEATCRRLLP